MVSLSPQFLHPAQWEVKLQKLQQPGETVNENSILTYSRYVHIPTCLPLKLHADMQEIQQWRNWQGSLLSPSLALTIFVWDNIQKSTLCLKNEPPPPRCQRLQSPRVLTGPRDPHNLQDMLGIHVRSLCIHLKKNPSLCLGTMPAQADVHIHSEHWPWAKPQLVQGFTANVSHSYVNGLIWAEPWIQFKSLWCSKKSNWCFDNRVLNGTNNYPGLKLFYSL